MSMKKCRHIYVYILNLLNTILRVLFLNFNSFRVIYKLLASTSEGIRVQALKAIGYFLKHLAPKWVCMKSKMNCRILLILQKVVSLLILLINYLNLILCLHIRNKGVAVYCLSSMTLIWIFHLFLFVIGTHV